MPADLDNCARSAKASKLGKLKRRLVDLLRQVLKHINISLGGAGCCPFVVQHLWDKCRRAGSWLLPGIECAWLWQCVGIPSSDDLAILIHCVTSAIQKQQLAERAERARIWKDRFVTSWHDKDVRRRHSEAAW